MPALLLLLLLPCLAFAQPDTTWSRSFVVNDRSFLYDVEVASDSIIVGVGYAQTGSGFTANWDFLITAYTTSGDSLYAHTILATQQTETLEGLCVLGGDTVVAVGWSVSSGQVLNLIAFHASTGEIIWSRAYQGVGQSKGRSVIALEDGRLVATGYKRGSGNQSDLWLLMFDSNGDTLWTRSSGMAGTDIGNDLVQLPNGNLRIGAIFREAASSDWDMWTTVYDLDGNVVGAQQFFGTTGSDLLFHMAVDPEQRHWLIGSTAASGGSGYVTILPPTGPATSLIFSSPGYGDTFTHGLPWFGGMLFSGRSGNDGAFTGPFMRAIDPANETVWTWRFGAIGSEGGLNSIAQLPDGGAVTVGAYVSDADSTDIRAFILAISPPAGVQGTVLGSSDSEPVAGARVQAVGDDRFTLTSSEGIYRLDLATGAHDIVVSGNCIEADTVFNVVVIENELAQADFAVGQPIYGHLQSSVNIIVENQIQGGAPMTIGNSGTGVLSFSVTAEAINPTGSWITVEPANGVVQPGAHAVVNIIVETDTTNDSIFEFFGRVTVRSNACPDSVVTLPVLVTVLDTETRTAIPSEFSLSPAYPNPFNSSTTLTLTLPVETELRLEVYNLTGWLVRALIDGKLSAGSHRINIDLNSEAAGLYLVRAQTPTTSAVQKLLYIR